MFVILCIFIFIYWVPHSQNEINKDVDVPYKGHHKIRDFKPKLKEDVESMEDEPQEEAVKNALNLQKVCSISILSFLNFFTIHLRILRKSVSMSICDASSTYMWKCSEYHYFDVECLC